MTDEEQIAKAQAIVATASEVLDGVDGYTACKILAAFAVSMIAGNASNTEVLKASATVFGECFNNYMSRAIAMQEADEEKGDTK